MTTITIGNGNTVANEGVLTNSTLTVGNGNDTITLLAGSTDDLITVGHGNDVLDFDDLSHSTITIASGNDTLIANGAGDTIVAGDGKDAITANGNGDAITVGNGNNTVVAKGTGDTISVGNGNNDITAGDDDTITIGNGNSTIVAGANTNIGPSTNGRDNGNHNVTVGPGSAVVLGDGSNNVTVGADSTVDVGNGSDLIFAGTSDAISLSHGADEIVYNGLTPQFIVPSSLSVLEGQSVALPITLGPPALGHETVSGFRPQQDMIALDTADFANFAAVKADAAQVGANTVITLDPGDSITLENVALNSLGPSNFQFFSGASDNITISGVPLDATLSAGTSQGNGIWSLTPSQLPGLMLNAGEPAGFPTPVELDVTATNPSGQMASSSQDVGLVVNAIPPTVGVSVLAPQAGDPVTETRLQISSATDDPDGGSDFINRIELSGVPLDVSLSSPGNTVTSNGAGTWTIATTGHPGSFNPEVDVLAPSGQSTNFNLGITAFADEPNSPEVSSSTSQNINVDFSTVSENPQFTSSGQSIWTSGTSFSKSFDNFLGFTVGPKSGSTGFNVSFSLGLGLGSTVSVGQKFGGSFFLKTGFQSDLNVNGGTFTGSLPFNVTLADTFNKTNNTLEIDPSESQLGGGNFSTMGPGGSYELDFILDAMAKAFTSGTFGSLGVTIGPFNEDINLLNKNSSSLNGTFNLPDGIGSVAFNFPQVNTAGSNPNPGQISAKGTSPPVFQLSLDPIAIVLDAILGDDPFKGSFLDGHVNYTLLAATVAPGVDVQQSFNLNASGLTPTLKNGNNSVIPFSFGTPTIIDHPTSTSFTLGLTPDATLENDTSLGGQLVVGLKALAGNVKLTALGLGTTIGFGPLIHAKTTFGPATLFSLFKNTFPVAFNQQNVNFTAS